ncbi:MAG: glycosyltransferase family 4 protein, partial [Planctomycetes bacterium]|nr:glycosyltransferase family 4 protein [Planctomycetota bacterium]
QRSVAMGRTVVGRCVKRISRWLNARQRFLLATERGLLTRPSPPYVAAVSQYVKRQVQRAYGTPPERVRVVFNGVAIEPLANDDAKAERTELRGRYGCSAEARVVLFVAHNFKLKGLAELIRATAGEGGARPGWTCWVAGRDNATPYRRLATSLGVERDVAFLGADVPMGLLYAAADVLAHPTFYDPCSRVVLESLCCGLPVVTTRHNGAAEVMRAGVHGEVVDSPRAIDALRRAIENCLSPAVRDACRSDAAAMRTRLSMSRHAGELMELYEQVLSSKRGAAS